jgi:transcriptional regulator with XRE-family HTH domain
VTSIHRPDYLEFIARLRKKRQHEGLTQAELAEIMGVRQSFIAKVETCERRLDVIEAAHWCAALGVSIDDLLPSGLVDTLRNSKHKSSGQAEDIE